MNLYKLLIIGLCIIVATTAAAVEIEHINISDKQVIFSKKLNLEITFISQPDAVYINNTPLNVQDNKIIKYIEFSTYGKQKIVIRSVQNNQTEMNEYKVLVVPYFSDIQYETHKNIYLLGVMGIIHGNTDETIRLQEQVTYGQLKAIIKNLKNKNALTYDLTADEKEKFERTFFKNNQVINQEDIKPLFEREGVIRNETTSWKPITRRELFEMIAELPKIKNKIQEIESWETGVFARPITIDRGKYISIDIKNVELSTVFKQLAEDAHINVLVDKEVKGKVTVKMKNQPAIKALNAIARMNNLAVHKKDNMYFVSKKGTNSKNTMIQSFRVNYVDINTIKDEIIQLMPEVENNILIGPASNSVIINAQAVDVEKVGQLINTLDKPPLQALVEAKIFEVSLSDEESLGIIFNSQGDDATAQTAGFAKAVPAANNSGLYIQVLEGDTQINIEALATKDKLNLISAPKIIALNNQTAVIETGKSLGYRVKTTTYTGGNTSDAEDVRFLDISTRLAITPRIGKDGYILLKIQPEISDGTIIEEIPQKQYTRTQTEVLVKNKQTIVIGGLIYDREEEIKSQVPFLGDIPLIGIFFRKKTYKKDKREIIIVITPTIIDYETAQKIKNESEEKMKNKKNKINKNLLM
ncbi:type II secretion system protein GspD [Candidatus Margulisiibacteriota bacterium]